MDTLHFEPQSFHSPRVKRLFGDQEAPRIDEMNLSELEVFMLRGRRLQAQTIGGALRHAFANRGAGPMATPARGSRAATATRKPLGV